MQDNNHFQNLKQKLETRHQEIKKNLVEKHAQAFEWATYNTRQLAAGAMGSLLLLSAPTTSLLTGSNNIVHEQFLDIPQNVFLVSDLKQYLPDQVGTLVRGQEDKLADILSQHFGFSVKPEIDGFRLLHTYGYIGAEQHLMRYPGDTMASHFDNPEDSNKYYSSGMAPGRGGFGYFAQGDELSQEEIDREKYYIAVQTFLAPGIENNRRAYIDFFKYRKMLVVNPNTGRAMVVVIGDAGPAVWTGKQLGGSPEVMKHLERVDGKAKGAVLYFFIEDPENKIPLGPIEPTAIKG